ncbi:MAG TPA: hypothetical protein VIA06_06385 [Candidatus Dormibacteraeota bacterium]|jgi:hypothetical protein|nr:hypothetical protein [Candidatus Dormibacteraeota bacterium]
MTEQEVTSWFAGRVPSDWFSEPPTIEDDQEEVWVVGPVPEPEIAADAGPEARAAARAARAQRFREETREQRMRIAREAEHRFGRRVAWGVVIGEERHMFTHRSTPVMTRLHLPERRVLDTLVDAGVARSRSEALAWCVRLVGRHQADWIEELRVAMGEVEAVRRRGPA